MSSDSENENDIPFTIEAIFTAFDQINITPEKLLSMIKLYLPEVVVVLERHPQNTCAEIVGVIKREIEWTSHDPVRRVCACFTSLQRELESQCDLSTLLEHLESLKTQLSRYHRDSSDIMTPTLVMEEQRVQTFTNHYSPPPVSEVCEAIAELPLQVGVAQHHQCFARLLDGLLCITCHHYLFNQPRQCPCGDCICGPCYDAKGGNVFTCPQCDAEVVPNECFRDRAVEHELQDAVIRCFNSGCQWQGSGAHYLVNVAQLRTNKLRVSLQSGAAPLYLIDLCPFPFEVEHERVCESAIVCCPNSRFGCQVKMVRSTLDEHTHSCRFTPVTCRWCQKRVLDEMAHIQNECTLVWVHCPSGCGRQMPKREVVKHMQTMCTHSVRRCEFHNIGCQFMGNARDLARHERDLTYYHNRLLRRANHNFEQTVTSQILSLNQQLTAARTQITQLQEESREKELLIQTLQEATYDGVFIWKIPEIQRRRQEAKTGRTVSLYSSPFYTSRYGYKLCLRLYLNGDGSGRDTHLSYFITIMRGEYDALLPWPFKQTVTFKLLNQDKQEDIVQSFHPEPSSSSFQRPRNDSDMNVASGCPRFASISVLNNSSYVVTCHSTPKIL